MLQTVSYNLPTKCFVFKLRRSSFFLQWGLKFRGTDIIILPTLVTFFLFRKNKIPFFFIAQRALWLKICAFKNNRIVKLKYVVDWKFWHGFIQFLLWYIYNSKGMIFTFVKQIALKYSQKHSDVKDRYRCQSG